MARTFPIVLFHAFLYSISLLGSCTVDLLIMHSVIYRMHYEQVNCTIIVLSQGSQCYRTFLTALTAEKASNR